MERPARASRKPVEIGMGRRSRTCLADACEACNLSLTLSIHRSLAGICQAVQSQSKAGSITSHSSSRGTDLPLGSSCRRCMWLQRKSLKAARGVQYPRRLRVGLCVVLSKRVLVCLRSRHATVESKMLVMCVEQSNGNISVISQCLDPSSVQRG